MNFGMSLPDGVWWGLEPLAPWVDLASGELDRTLLLDRGEAGGDRCAAQRGGLGPDEWERARAYSRVPALRFVAGRMAARAAIARQLGLPAHEVMFTSWCPRCGKGAHGRPQLRRVGGDALPYSLSLSRAGEHVLVALAPEGTALGADLVRRGDPGLQPGEAGFVALPEDWALAEARGKAAGVGIVEGEQAARSFEWVGSAGAGYVGAVVAGEVKETPAG